MSIEALKEQARNHEQNEDWAKALQAYEEAIRRQSDEDQPDLGLYNRAGDLSTRLQDPIGAIGHYERAVDLYLESELPNNAIAILKKILRNMPDRAEVYLRMGQIRASQGFLTDARDNFLIYAESMQQSGNLEEALRALSEFADLAPDDTEIRLRLADQFQAHEKPSEALDQLFRAHNTLSARGDESGVAGVEERIRAIDPEAVVPDAPVLPPGSGYGGAPAPARGSQNDSAAPGEIAFDGEFGLDTEDTVIDEGAPAAHEGREEDIEETGGQWSSSATEADAPHDIVLEDRLDGLTADDETTSVPRLETTDFHPDDASGLEGAYIDFDVAAPADEVESTAAAPEDDNDAWSATAIESSLEVGAEQGEPGEAFEAALDDSVEVSLDDALDNIAEVSLDDDVDDSLEVSLDDALDDSLEVSLDDALDDSLEVALDETEDDAAEVALGDASDDLPQEDIGGELPLLSFDDDSESAEAAVQVDEAAVAVETSLAEAEDEWIGLEDEPAVEVGTTNDTGAWDSGTEFELETVQFESLGEDELSEFVVAHPESGQAWEHLGRAVAVRGDQSAAAEAFESAHAAYAADRDFHSAMRSVRELLLIDPDSIAYHQRLVEYAHRGDDRTLLVSAFLELGDCLKRTGAPEKSDAVYEKVLEIDPGNVRARSAMGLADEADAAAPDDSGYVDLGSMVLEKRERTTRWTVESEEPTTADDFDFGAMLKQFRAKVAEHVDVNDVQAHYDLGTAYKEMGLLDEAISEFQQALRADGRNLATFEVLGQSFMEKGQPEAAIRTLTRATGMPFEVEDELLGIYYYLGRAYEELGNRDEAVEYYEKVFALDINFEDVTERLRSLR